MIDKLHFSLFFAAIKQGAEGVVELLKWNYDADSCTIAQMMWAFLLLERTFIRLKRRIYTSIHVTHP